MNKIKIKDNIIANIKKTIKRFEEENSATKRLSRDAASASNEEREYMLLCKLGPTKECICHNFMMCKDMRWYYVSRML